MRMSSFFSVAAVAILVAGCAIPVAAPARHAAPAAPAPLSASSYGKAEARIFDLINAQRRHQGLPALVYSERLDRAAKIQAENMAHFQKMAHTLPGARLPNLSDRARYVGYPYGRIAENVALGYPNPETVVEGWMNSTGHRHNILDKGVVETGIG